MIIRENIIEVSEINTKNIFKVDGYDKFINNAIFFDLEHYVYKKPICIGVFGCCYFDDKSNSLKVTQYMIERSEDNSTIVKMAKDYFNKMYNDGKNFIVTFSGNNDFTVINYLLKKYKIQFDFSNFVSLDIQELFKQCTGICTGLKIIEKQFNIVRNFQPISGSNLAKTFSKIIKDEHYIERMPKEKVEKILLYNEQDVVSLFEILTNWHAYVNEENNS